MKRYLVLVLLFCLLVGCGAVPTPTPSAGDTWTRPADDAAMVYVPAGEFLMGSTDEDIDTTLDECSDCMPDWFTNEQPQHTVYLDAFWIDRSEVTNVQYRKCVEAGACEEPACWDDSDYNAPDQPVVCVRWDDAQDYAAWVGGRLPTEAEWEKAARGTDGRIYPWGNSSPDCDRANYYGCVGKPLPGGSHSDGASPYGALDMVGNVWEWVADWYADDYDSRSPAQNSQGPESGNLRVLRGGSFYYLQGFVRCACRYGVSPINWNKDCGFRVVVASVPSDP